MSRLSIKRIGTINDRPKAFWGTLIASAIGAGVNIYNNYKNRQAQVQANNDLLAAENAEMERQNRQIALNNEANAMNNFYTTQDLYNRNLRKDYIYSCGGRKSLRAATGAKVKITDGLTGVVPLGNNTFLLQGSSHNQVNESGHTGIGMKVGKRTIEAEGGEAVQFKPNSLRIFSNRIRPELLSGFTPSRAIQLGYNPDVVFPIQQEANGNHSTPVKGNRHKAALGNITPYDWINLGSDAGTALGIGIGNLIGYKGLNTNLITPDYFEETSVKLDPTYHNKAQLANLERMRLAGNKTISRNTTSSSVAQARMRLNDLDYMSKQNELLDYAANYNANIRNRQAEIEQGVRQRNTERRNAHAQILADTINRERELKNNQRLMLTQNHANTLAGINRGLSNFTGSILQREQDLNSIRAYMAASNPGTMKVFYNNGGTLGRQADIEFYNSLNDEEDKELKDKMRIRLGLK